MKALVMLFGNPISKLLKFVKTERWRHYLAYMMAGHYGDILDEMGIDNERFRSLRGGFFEITLFNCAFEDLMSRRFEQGSLNLIDDYLKRHGWRESAATKMDMRVMRDSVRSLYEVTDVIPGKSFVARDLLRGGDKFQVDNLIQSHALKQYDIISAKIMPSRTAHILSNATLRLSPETADELMSGLHTHQGLEGKPGPLKVTDRVLVAITHLFTIAWLRETMPEALELQRAAG